MKNDNAVQHNNQTASEQTLSPDEGHVLHKVRDPVCGMAILPDRAHSSIRYQDHQLYSAPPAVRVNLKPIPIVILPKMPVNIPITITTIITKSALIR
ncbi:putative cation transporting P-type ATPase (silver resistance) [Klebsiella pneumoniae]|uniref:Putative cation transporting P-type ATPase (Silver resistance) n=1 Tax=Klebsiella pneumoniae TaxID=573 RepID=A0A2X3BP68_KLEPN|nr:putative cation transporting P-type ATPase (silver resistance) [Klebsiella pneumoniae]